jgi:signal transduction histidine kinase
MLVGRRKNLSMNADDEAHAENAAEMRPPQRPGERQSSMTELMAALVHELNQPLSAAANYIEAAQRLLQAKPQRSPHLDEALDHAAAQMLRAGRMVRDLHEVLSLGDPQKSLQSLHEILRQSCERAGPIIKDHKVALSLQLNADKDLVLADETQIQQALVTVIRNACDTMRVSKVRRLTLATSRKDETLRVDVIDTGEGLSHVDPVSSGRPVGLVLGLMISRSIIEAHQGKIWAESDPGGRARLSFTLPLAK